jgi:isopentenyl diphosphate isomerase/L-lactate dehydrogenase-like FMN-dependent dehydrogenase
VVIGRPALWALAAADHEGVEQVIKGMTDELADVMVQLGTTNLEELTRDVMA